MNVLTDLLDAYGGVVLGLLGGALCAIVLVAIMDRHKCSRLDHEKRDPPRDD
ncbi:MAG: hypothetical protein R3F49_10200 [Planctomycetota bacterium]